MVRLFVFGTQTGATTGIFLFVSWQKIATPEGESVLSRTIYT